MNEDKDFNHNREEKENLDNYKVKVAVRIRPFLQKELLEKSNKCITTQENKVPSFFNRKKYKKNF